jgi:hypothetical protein
VAHTRIVTITYLNGTTLKAIPLAYDQNVIRAVAPGGDDVLVFTRIHDTWISEETEPVTIEFEWQRGMATGVPSEDECICPKELAAHLIQALISGEEAYEAGANSLYAFSPEGTRAAV